MGNNRFSDGFLLGALIGGAAVFLLGTKKGNKILKSITEEGLDGLTEIIENFEEEREGAKPKPHVPKKVKTEPATPEYIEEKIELEPVPAETNGHSSVSPARRFFKRNK